MFFDDRQKLGMDTGFTVDPKIVPGGGVVKEEMSDNSNPLKRTTDYKMDMIMKMMMMMMMMICVHVAYSL